MSDANVSYLPIRKIDGGYSRSVRFWHRGNEFNLQFEAEEIDGLAPKHLESHVRNEMMKVFDTLKQAEGTAERIIHG